WIEEYKEHQNLFCVVYRPDGALHARTPGLGDESVPPPPGAQAPLAYDEALPVIGRQRVMAERVRLGDRELIVLLLAPLKEGARDRDRAGGALLAAGLLPLPLSAGLAYALARQALAPVDQLRRATDAVNVDRLDQRLSVPSPHDELGRLARTIN